MPDAGNPAVSKSRSDVDIWGKVKITLAFQRGEHGESASKSLMCLSYLCLLFLISFVQQKDIITVRHGDDLSLWGFATGDGFPC